MKHAILSLFVDGVAFGSADFNELLEELRFSDIVFYYWASYTVPTDPFDADAHT